MPDQSPFDTLEASFRLLCAGPSPLALDGWEVGPPLPPRAIPLTELSALLLHPATPYETRDRAIGLLARRAQDEGGRWVVGLVGILLPGLRAAVADVVKTSPDGGADVEADVLAELVDVVRRFDPGTERAASRLLWRAAARARRRALKDQAEKHSLDCEALDEQADTAGRVAQSPSAEPHPAWGHPDFVLAEAVKANFLSPFEAALIGDTRLGGVTVAAWAARVGWQPASLRKERSVAERRLADWIARGKPTRESKRGASFRGAGRPPADSAAGPARVAHPAAGTREVSPLALRQGDAGATCPELDGSDRRSA
jgi:hypothetical protein